MGYVDNDGFLYVVGRFKSLLISSDGEKYSPEGIEESLSDNSYFIDQVVLHNNQDPFTTALIVPNKEALKRYVHRKKPELNWDSPEAKKLALNKLQREINEYRKGGKYEGMFPERWLPTAVAVIGEPFTEQNGLVNSSMKSCARQGRRTTYAGRIAGLYANGKEIINQDNIDALA